MIQQLCISTIDDVVVEASLIVFKPIVIYLHYQRLPGESEECFPCKHGLRRPSIISDHCQLTLHSVGGHTT